MELLINFLLNAGMLAIGLTSFLLLKKKGRVLSRRILGIIFILLLFVTIHSYGEFNKISWLIWLGFPITDTIGFLIGPVLYFYVIALFKPKRLQPKVIAIHLLPAVLYIVFISVPFLISIIQDRYFFDFLEFLDRNEYLLHIQACYLLVYCLWSLITLSKYRSISKTYYSNLKKIDVRWIKYLIWGIMGIMLLDLSLVLFSGSIKVPHLSGDQIITMAMVILVLYLAYYGTHQSQILLPEYSEGQVKGLELDSTNTPSHHLANATAEEITHLKNRLHVVLKNQRPYADENLTLASLAQLLPTTDRKLSALLNHYLDTSFYDLVNSYRVREVKEKMVLPEYNKLTLLAVAFEAGFNSKTSFNRIFKKETGLSPSSYKKTKIKK